VVREQGHRRGGGASPRCPCLVDRFVTVLGGGAVAIAFLPFLVGAEIVRDVAADRHSMPVRPALEAAARRAAPAVRWTLATMLLWVFAWAGLLAFAFGFISIFDHDKAHANPVLAFMLPGSVAMVVGIAAGCVAAVRAVQELARLHARVSGGH
jgi:hypothetical protein